MSNSVSVISAQPPRSQFDYTQLPPVEEKKLRELATDIQARGRRATRLAAKIGDALLDAKRHLVHGQFSVWCRSEANVEPRVAQAYMNLATFAKGHAWVTRLPLTAACRIAAPSMPDEVILAVRSLVASGEKVKLAQIDYLTETSRSLIIDVVPPAVDHNKNTATLKNGSDEVEEVAKMVTRSLEPTQAKSLAAFLQSATVASIKRFSAELGSAKAASADR